MKNPLFSLDSRPFSQRGNALFLVLIAVALFAAMSYAVTKSGAGGGTITREKAILDAAVTEQCMAYVESAANKLKLFNNCTDSTLSYQLADGTNPNPLAPADKSCHVFDAAGGGYTACGPYLGAGCSDAQLAGLSLGQRCVNVVYAGTSNGNRLYTTLADSGSRNWNNGTANAIATGQSSFPDGLANTNAIVALSNAASPYQAAATCRSLGSAWYLPAYNELSMLCTNQNEGVLKGTFNATGVHYWSSTEDATDPLNKARSFRFNGCINGFTAKNTARQVRCVRR